MIRLTRLPNGLRVASRDMPGFETVAVGLYADAGSRHEPEAVNGIAHLFEHMVFKGAGGRSAREISETVEDVGGDLNASTDRDSTNFAATMLAEHIPLGVELLADLILNAHLDPQELEREKDVVLQELAEARDTPGDIIFDELWSAAFGGQPLGRSVLGDEASIARITAADLHAWRHDHFRADNVCLVAAGKVDHEALVAQAESRLGELAAGTAAFCEQATFTADRRVLRGRSDQAHLTFAFAGPAATSRDYPAARLFADILGGGASSRLFQAVREERGLAYSVSASAYAYADIGIMSVHAATSARNALAASQLIAELIEQTAADLTEKELDRAKTQARAGLLMSLESTWGQANFVARQLSLHDRLVEPAEVLEASAHVTVDQVRAIGAAMVSGPRASASIGTPAVRAA
ncbi:MAG TPA: pitrilysin family protein [Sphingomicrobium sp.]|jgi:predicted Zn-dependent peptidase